MGRYGEVVTSLNLSLICQNPPESPHENAGMLYCTSFRGRILPVPKTENGQGKFIG